jgi:hypothetical protein
MAVLKAKETHHKKEKEFASYANKFDFASGV